MLSSFGAGVLRERVKVGVGGGVEVGLGVTLRVGEGGREGRGGSQLRATFKKRHVHDMMQRTESRESEHQLLPSKDQFKATSNEDMGRGSCLEYF